ncbi:hypothetical protein [Candidatus Neoehrlichia procyonis]|uniref:Uncharacterized protein n=1 Tax=Candidatus Neoehrlichia procyonis str. RAC413 TaxID=1359163 RepID=A0A0F3NM85_9RICK|nr:hypothetical protein [Candidatus Neoehrlichia lotoris]KJV69140.1 hypothetical protein NLO413_0516 [Candidatus Neoehrlichia lotoris str. RAC413]
MLKKLNLIFKGQKERFVKNILKRQSFNLLTKKEDLNNADDNIVMNLRTVFKGQKERFVKNVLKRQSFNLLTKKEDLNNADDNIVMNLRTVFKGQKEQFVNSILEEPRADLFVDSQKNLHIINSDSSELYDACARINERMQIWKYAARQFGACAKNTKYCVPKEQQISISLSSDRVAFDHRRNMGVRYYHESVYQQEVGTENRKFSRNGPDVFVNRFTMRDQYDAIKVIRKNKGYRLFDKDGNVYDTTGRKTKNIKDAVAYVITLDGKLIISDKQTHIPLCDDNGVFHVDFHSTLLRHKPGICAGMMKVKNGKITMINISSGHYTPTQENLFNAVKILDKAIASNADICSYYDIIIGNEKDIKSIVIQRMFIKENKKEFLHRMESKGDDGLAIPERYFNYMRQCKVSELSFVNNDSLIMDKIIIPKKAHGYCDVESDYDESLTVDTSESNFAIVSLNSNTKSNNSVPSCVQNTETVRNYASNVCRL